MGVFGSGSGDVDTRFERKGESNTTTSRTSPPWIESLLKTTGEGGAVSSSLADKQGGFLRDLFSRDFNEVEGQSTIDALRGIAPDTFSGSSSLASIASQDPYSSSFLESMEPFYDDIFSQASAAAKTGPDSVRGGVAHGAFAESSVLEKAGLNKFRELTDLQQRQAGTTVNATQSLQNISNQRRAIQAGAQDNWMRQILGNLGTGIEGSGQVNQQRGIAAVLGPAAAEVLGGKTGTTTDDLKGRGGQTSSHAGWNAGLTCCFIFLEALNGKLPWYVRAARDSMCNPVRVAGYRRMSRWLVPLMHDFSAVRFLVNLLMIKPFLKWGAFLYEVEGSKKRWKLWEPVCRGWFRLWDKYGEKGNVCL